MTSEMLKNTDSSRQAGSVTVAQLPLVYKDNHKLMLLACIPTAYA